MPLRDKNDEAPPRLCGRKPPLITTVEMEKELPATDPMRVIWRAVNALDWSGYYRRLRARGSRAGRPAYDPRVLAALRIWGFREKVFSARALAKRSKTDWVCWWVLGGKRGVSYHTLSDFLRQEGEVLDDLLSQTITVLHSCGAVSFDTLLVDGTRTDARASADSFHDEAGLLAAVSQKLLSLRERGPGDTARERAARKRAERELRSRQDEAVEKLRSRQADLGAQGPKAMREKSGRVKTSLSDPDARMMRHADGGKRASVNIQVGSCAKSGAVLCMWATDRGGDRGLGAPNVREMERSSGHRPRRVIADGGYGGLRDAAEVRGLGVDYLVSPRPKARHPSRRAGLGGTVREADDWWHDLWAEHGSWARRKRLRVEHVIGSMKRCGLQKMPSFGLAAATRWARWQALTHNLFLLLRVRG